LAHTETSSLICDGKTVQTVGVKIFAALIMALALAACAPAAVGPELPPTPRLPGMTESHYLTLEGERVYYEAGGPSDSKFAPVLFIHGIGAGNSSHLWRENTASLAKTRRVYAFDFPGFARSGARAMRYTNDLYAGVVEQLLRQVVKAPATLIGGSLGSDYAIRVAVEHPELVRQLLLSNPTGYDPSLNFTRNQSKDLETYNLFSNTPVGGLTFGVLNSDAGLNFFLYNYVYLDWRRVTPDVTKIYMDNLAGPNKQYAPFSFFSGFLDQDVTKLWPQTKQPTLLVWGSDDPFTSIDYAKQFLKVRDVPLKILKARAIPYDEAFEEFNKIALEFLK
jgi:pimeloyl-ACP methyl ester carboxylesterase